MDRAKRAMASCAMQCMFRVVDGMCANTILCIVCVHGLPRAQDTRRWPLVEPLPSYGRGRELPGPRYASFIHGDGLLDVVITGELSLPFACSARLPPLPTALSVCCLLLCAREYPLSIWEDKKADRHKVSFLVGRRRLNPAQTYICHATAIVRTTRPLQKVHKAARDFV